MKETFVEACLIRYMMTHPINLEGTRFTDMSELIELYIDSDETDKKIGMIRGIIDVLAERENDTDKYKTMHDFMPSCIEVVNAYK